MNEAILMQQRAIPLTTKYTIRIEWGTLFIRCVAAKRRDHLPLSPKIYHSSQIYKLSNSHTKQYESWYFESNPVFHQRHFRGNGPNWVSMPQPPRPWCRLPPGSLMPPPRSRGVPFLRHLLFLFGRLLALWNFIVFFCFIMWFILTWRWCMWIVALIIFHWCG